MQIFTKYVDYRRTSLDWIQSKRSTVALRDQWIALCEQHREHSQSLGVTYWCKNPNASPSLMKNYEVVYFKLKSVHKQGFSWEAKSFESSKATSQKDSEPKANTTNTEVWDTSTHKIQISALPWDNTLAPWKSWEENLRDETSLGQHPLTPQRTGSMAYHHGSLEPPSRGHDMPSPFFLKCFFTFHFPPPLLQR